MIKKIKQYQRWLLSVLIFVCVGLILFGGTRYLQRLRHNLGDSAVNNLMTVTVQQQQAFDTFLSKDREQLHSIAEYFVDNGYSRPEDAQHMLSLFQEEDAIYLAMCLDEGWVCGTSFDDVRQLDVTDLEVYRALNGSGVRDTYIGLYSGTPRFGYYETFTFSNGHRGLIQKSYDRSKVSETFSLSFYNNQGFAYVVNDRGDILVRSNGMIGSRFYDNIFDILSGTNAQQEDIDQFMAGLGAHESGSMTFTGDMGRFIYTYVDIDNVDNWYLVSIVPEDAIDDETGRILLDSQITLGLLLLVLFICAVFILLTWRTQKEMKEKDREIAYQEQLFSIFTTYLSNNTNDMYLLMDHETEKVEYVSPNVERVLGVPREEVTAYLESSDRETDAAAADTYYTGVRALKPGQSAKSRSTERINPMTGEHKFFLESVYCALIQGCAKRVVYISDRTREYQTQNSLADALRMAQAANEAKSTFLSSVSHDIRTPMNAIIGFLSLMRDEVDNPATVMEYNRRIDAASQHLLGLINDVLDMNKIESGSTTLSIAEMNLADVIEEINTIIRPQARAKNQTFDIFVSPMTFEHLMGDKLRINQILINLLSNSVKYTPEGGAVLLRVEELPQVVDNYSSIRFTVSDNGLGMSEDYLKVIFDPFTREETEITHQIQGTGLGMAITKSLVDLMGGTIHVESELNKGSTFTVEMELRIQEKEEERDEEQKFWSDHKVKRMIVADDDEEVCLNIGKAMAKTGVITDYATDGETTVRMMRSARENGYPYDLILLDWQMPNLNGLETARLIRKNYSEKIPILLLTAYDWSEIEQEAMEIGVNHFMPKPFFMSTFKDAIRRVMGSPKKAARDDSDIVRNRHILVVDDIEVNRIILVKILSTLGATCDTAGNGREAVEKFEASKPGQYDLILMDVQMPLMDGYSATRTIRSSEHPMAREIPIIAMTANAFVDDVRDALESGMDAHVAKPVQLDKLKATIQEVLDGRREQV